MKSTPIGRIQCQTEPVPEVGSQPRPMAKTVIPTMAIQKSGAEAPISEVKVTIRSKMPPGRKAASEPMTMAADRDQRHGDDREPERPDEGLQHHVDRRARLPQAVAEVEVQHVPDVAAELHDDRIVQPVQLAELLDHLRRRVDRQEQCRRVAGQPRQEEDHDEQQHERDEARQDARDVSGHGHSSFDVVNIVAADLTAIVVCQRFQIGCRSGHARAHSIPPHLKAMSASSSCEFVAIVGVKAILSPTRAKLTMWKSSTSATTSSWT